MKLASYIGININKSIYLILGDIILLHFIIQAVFEHSMVSLTEYQVFTSLIYYIFIGILNKMWDLESFFDKIVMDIVS